MLYLYEPASFAPLAQLESAVVTTTGNSRTTDKATAKPAQTAHPAAVSSIRSASSVQDTGASSYEIRSGESKQTTQSLGGLTLGNGLGQGLGLGSALGSGQVKPALPLSSAASLRSFGGLGELGSLDATDPAAQASIGQILAAQLDGQLPVPNNTGQDAQTNNAETTEPTLQTVQRLYYYQNDQLGTPRELTNPEGDIAWSATYRAWGNTVKVDWAQTYEALQPNDLAANEAVHQPIRFQGQYFDAETGLHYNRFRYYDPDVGRFVSQDPIGLAGGDNLYMYAPNPVKFVDPFGLCSTALDKSLGGVPKDGKQAHHLIPEAVWKIHKDFFTAIGIDHTRDHRSNGLLMPGSAAKARTMKRHFYHCGSHANTSNAMDLQVQQISDNFASGRISAGEARMQISRIQGIERARLSMPGIGLGFPPVRVN